MATKVKKVKKVKKPAAKAEAKTPVKKSNTLPSKYKHLLARLKNLACALLEDIDQRRELKAHLADADNHPETVAALKSFGFKAAQIDQLHEEFFNAEVTRQR